METQFYSKSDLDSKQEHGPGENKQEPVIAKISQGYDTKISIRLVSAGELASDLHTPKCHPRNGADRHDTRPLDLPESIKKKFKDVNKQVMDWLGTSPENARLFLKDPVNALLKAGVELSRPEQKELSRNFQEVSDNHTVDPGVDIKEINVTAHPKGRVGNTKTNTEDKQKNDNDCGCK